VTGGGFRRLAAAGLALVAATTFAGCGTSPAPIETTTEPTATPRRPSEPRPGLVVERLRIRGDEDRLRAALASLPESTVDPEISERWRREGFLVRVIDEDTLADFEAELAPETIAVRTWHGEATGWRSAARRRLPRGSVIMLDGRARPIDERFLTLAVRGWSLPLVDGAGLQLELVPHLQATTIDPLAPPAPPGEFRGVPLVPAIERVLKPGDVLLLASVQDRRAVTPSMNDRRDPDGEPGDSPPPGASSPDSPASEIGSDEPSRDDRGPGPGPSGGLPPTLAACLVGEPIVGERGVMLFRGRPHPAVDLPPENRASPGPGSGSGTGSAD